MAITTVFLDLYQTLVYFHPPREERYAQALRELGLDAEQTALRRAYLAADHDYTLAGMKTPAHRMSKEERRRIMLRYHQVLLREAGLEHALQLAEQLYGRYWALSRELRLFPDVVPALTQLRQEGYRLGLITNVDCDPAGDLERLGIGEMFDGIAASCLVDSEKPNARIFQAALETLRVTPGESVHVGDLLLADVQGATDAGLTAVLLDRYDLQEGRYPLRVLSLLELPALLRNGVMSSE